MRFRSFIFLKLLATLSPVNTDIIDDYFIFKNVSRVAGISCGEIEILLIQIKYQTHVCTNISGPEDTEVIKALNNAGISVSIKRFPSTVDIAKFLHTSYWNLGIYLDLQCPFVDEDIVKFFSKASANQMFGHLHQWLILGKNMNETIKLINDRAFSITTDVVIALPRNNNYVLYDVYNHCKHCGGLLNITTFGTWTEDNGLQVTLSLNKFTRRWDYHNMNVKVAGIVTGKPEKQDLIQYLQERNNIQKDYLARVGYSIILHVADMFNMNFELIELTHWAKNDSNGPLMSGLKNGLYDIGFYPSILSNERFDLAKIILQVCPMRTCFMFLTVPSLRKDIIFRPFAKDIWYLTLLIIIIITLILYVILKVEKDVTGSDYGATIVIVVAALCQQGLPYVGNQVASRIAFLQTLIFGLLIYNYYSAAIVSSRLNAPLSKMNDSLYSLVKSKIKLAAKRDIYFNLLLHFPIAEIQYFKRYWDTIPEEKKFFSTEEGIRKIMVSEFAYHVNPVDAYPFIERIFDKEMICQLTEVHLLRPSLLGLWAARHGQFQEITKIGITTSGIRKREVSRWSPRTPYCNKDKHYVSSVTIGETVPIAFILFFGIILSAFICLMENIIFRLLRKKQKKVRKFEEQLDTYDGKNIMLESEVIAKVNNMFTSNKRS